MSIEKIAPLNVVPSASKQSILPATELLRQINARRHLCWAYWKLSRQAMRVFISAPSREEYNSMNALSGSLSLCLAGAGALLLTGAAEAATPMTPLTEGADVMRVAPGCGPGRWRGPGGGCHGPGYYGHPYGYGYHPYGYGYHPYGYGYHPYYHHYYQPQGGNSGGANFPQ